MCNCFYFAGINAKSGLEKCLAITCRNGACNINILRKLCIKVFENLNSKLNRVTLIVCVEVPDNTAVFVYQTSLSCCRTRVQTKENRTRLFESYATIWCEMRSDEAIINQIAYDVHSPSYIRVNAILSSIDEFYETYDVKEGDGMYIAPEERVSRWY